MEVTIACNSLTAVTDHEICHTLLERSKVQVLPTLKGRALHESVNKHGGEVLPGVILEPVPHILEGELLGKMIWSIVRVLRFPDELCGLQ